jgi:hypothetical protein
MPSAKSGTAGTADAPTDPKVALEALDDKPGDVSDTSANPAQTQSKNWDSTKVDGETENGGSSDSSPNSWIGVELKDTNGKPIPNEPFQVKLSDGSITSGTLDDKGRARVEGVKKGQCEVRFPNRHNSEWKKA